MGVGLGDLDGDGDLDAYVTNWSQPNKVWLFDSTTNGFTDSSQSLGNTVSGGVSLADFDGDGDLDAFVANYNGVANKVWVNNGSATFTDSGISYGSGRSYGVSSGDLDGDGDIDAFIANAQEEGIESGFVKTYNKVFLNDDSSLYWQQFDTETTSSIENDFDESLGAVDGWSIDTDATTGKVSYKQASTTNGLSLSVLDSTLTGTLPDVFDLSADISSLTGGSWHDGFLVFDYVSATDFKYAGFFTGQNEWVIGHYSPGFGNRQMEVEWDDPTHSDDTESHNDSDAKRFININEDYFVHLRIDSSGTDATVELYVDGEFIGDATYTGTALNDGKVGMMTNNAPAQFDNFKVATYTASTSDNLIGTKREYGFETLSDDFEGTNAAKLFNPEEATYWTVKDDGSTTNNVLEADTTAETGLSSTLIDIPGKLTSNYEITVDFESIETPGEGHNAYILFDYKSATNFKYAVAKVGQNAIEIGYNTGSGFIGIDEVPVTINTTDTTSNKYRLELIVEGTKTTLNLYESTDLTTPYETVEATFFNETGNVSPTTSSLHKNKVGLGVYSGVTYFDNLTISEYPAPSASPVAPPTNSPKSSPLASSLNRSPSATALPVSFLDYEETITEETPSKKEDVSLLPSRLQETNSIEEAPDKSVIDSVLANSLNDLLFF